MRRRARVPTGSRPLIRYAILSLPVTPEKAGNVQETHSRRTMEKTYSDTSTIGPSKSSHSTRQSMCQCSNVTRKDVAKPWASSQILATRYDKFQIINTLQNC